MTLTEQLQALPTENIGECGEDGKAFYSPYVKLSDVLALLTAQPEPTQEWRCWHCDEVFIDKEQAAEHFGRDEAATPACRLSKEDVKQLRALEEYNAKLEREYANLENEARLWHESDADRQRRIGNRQWWQAQDELQGEILALKEQLAKASAPTPSAWQLANDLENAVNEAFIHFGSRLMDSGLPTLARQAAVLLRTSNEPNRSRPPR